MKNAHSILVMVLCFLLGMVTINLLTGCQAEKPAEKAPAGSEDDTSGENSNTSTDDVPDKAPADGDAPDALDAPAPAPAPAPADADAPAEGGDDPGDEG